MATNIDKTSGLPYQIKRPAPETRVYSVNFKNLLLTIASVTSVVPSDSSLTISNIAFTGTVVSFQAANGTDGKDYEITITVVDGLGNIISDDVMLKVRKAGLV